VTADRRHPRHRERGEVTTQLVVLTPVVLALLLAIVQLSLWVHSAHVATAAAAEAVSVASRRDGSASAGAAAASTVVSEAGSRLAGAPVVARSATWSTAEVRVGVPRVLPGFPERVARRAAGPVERFVPESGS
jgi:Flp pilus assembly protein TadG